MKEIKPENSRNIKRLYEAKIEIILYTKDETEYQAALKCLEPPSNKFKKCAVYSSGHLRAVIGIFAGHYTALVHRNRRIQSNTIKEHFPRAQLMIAVGHCISFDRKKHKLGDVLVSKRISLFRVNSEGDDVHLQQTHGVDKSLYKIFCLNLCFNEEFEVTTSKNPDRLSKVHAGTFVLFHDYLEFYDELRYADPEVIGIYSGGPVLQYKDKFEPIIINGVAGYGDGTSSEEWKFTASMAALTYARDSLYYYKNINFDVVDICKLQCVLMFS